MRRGGRGQQERADLVGDRDAVGPIGCSPRAGWTSHEAKLFKSMQAPVNGGLGRVDMGRQLGFGSVAGEKGCQHRRAWVRERVEQIRRPTVHVLFNTE